jgi:hypothetical protein
MDRTYRDAPGIWKRYSFSRSKMVIPGSVHFRHLEGSFLAGGEFVEPFLVWYLP